ncbi:hypothetical protein [Acinetobacter rongchengensis]|nr:hypothetical protein [Acinetobacter rongchengensis]
MESNQKDLFNKVCYLQGYLDCLTNIDSDFKGSFSLHLSSIDLKEFLNTVLTYEYEDNFEKNISSFNCDKKIEKEEYSYEFIENFLNKELILKPFDNLCFSKEKKDYVIYNFMEELRYILDEELNIEKPIEYCSGLTKTSFSNLGDEKENILFFSTKVINFHLNESQYFTMVLKKNVTSK